MRATNVLYNQLTKHNLRCWKKYTLLFQSPFNFFIFPMMITRAYPINVNQTWGCLPVAHVWTHFTNQIINFILFHCFWTIQVFISFPITHMMRLSLLDTSWLRPYGRWSEYALVYKRYLTKTHTNYMSFNFKTIIFLSFFTLILIKRYK